MSAIDRLRGLVKRGYRPEWETDVEGALWLAHPARGERGPKKTCILYDDGLVVAYNNVPTLSNSNDEVRIPPADDTGYGRFLRATPLPTWWEKTADFRYSVLAWSILIGFGLAINVVLRFIISLFE